MSQTRASFLGIGLSAVIAAVSIVFLARYLGNVTVVTAVGAGLVYLISHVLRALRLAILSIDLLGISGRTAGLLHLVTAPLALVLPLKTGELLRWHQLWRLSRSAIYPLIVLLIDRMFDSLFLVPVLLILVSQDSAPPALILLTMLVAIVPLVVLVVGPKLLTEMQRYVVINHNNARTLDVLRQVDALRSLVVRAAFVARHRAPELCLLSLLIWLCEFVVCLILIGALVGVTAGLGENALELMGVRLVAPIWSLEAGTVASSALSISLITLLLPWPILVMFYLRRRRYEPSRVPTGGHSETGMAL